MAVSGPYTDPFKADTAHITESDANLRSTHISEVAYRLQLVLPKGSKYAGRMTVDFESNSADVDLWLDFNADEILTFTVNGEQRVPKWERSKLFFGAVHTGHNSAEITFNNTYGHDGTGIHHFTDIADGEEYIYTQFEAPYAHTAFPCFDQPNLKATLSLTVVAPSVWRVIANEPGSTSPFTKSTDPIYAVLPQGQFTLHTFAQTKRISTYLYAVCAGPYSEWRKDSNESGVPLGLYCRKSLEQYCKPDRIFRWTVQGFLFYRQFFGVGYPFAKYDQVYVPEFKFGAMENVGCVTYRDEYVFRDDPSPVMLARVCNTFLHEMAHMWFGNLVTMRWWEDLWLNESFATYISHVCQANQLSSEFPDVWNDFLSGKGWGYSTDQLSTTHPICVKVAHTGETETNFDGISYSKGSSVLKQLHFLIGDDVFRSSLQEYIQSNQYKNTEFHDLISVISKHAQRASLPVDIEKWSDTWVKTAGLNSLQADFQVHNGKISRFAIRQGAVLEAHPTLRPHKILVEMYDGEMGSVWKGALLVNPEAETVFSELNGIPAPSCVLLNAEDHAFAKVIVDTQSLAFLQSHIRRIPSSLTKQVTLRAIWDMVRDTRYSGVEFIDLVAEIVREEKDLTICNYLLELGTAAVAYYLPRGMAKKVYASKLFGVVLTRLKASSTQEEILIFQKKLIRYLYHPFDILLAKDWVISGDTGIPNFKLGQNDRWTILAAYAGISHLAKPLVDEEAKRDKTSAGVNYSYYCSALYPDPYSKESAWRKLTQETSKYSNYELQYLCSGFNHSSHTWLYHPYFSHYFPTILSLLSSTERELGRIVAEGLLPSYADDQDVIRLIEENVGKVQEDRVDVIRPLKEERDDLIRTSKGRLLSEQKLYPQD